MKTNHYISVLFLSFIMLLPGLAFCQDVKMIFSEAQRLEDNRQETEALKKYQEVVTLQPTHVAGLCKVSELQSVIGSRQQDRQVKLQYYKVARQTAEAALKINPNYSDANFVMALAMGRMALVLNGQDKIRAVTDIKKYAEAAIRNDPTNYKAYHVLGKWHFEVSSLNAFERMGVKLLFGGFPPASYQESIRCYEKSRSLNPLFALNYLEAAKAYHRNDQDNQAIELLKKLQTIPVKMTDDPRIKKEGNRMLKQLQG